MKEETKIDFTRVFNIIMSKDPSTAPSARDLSIEFGLGNQSSLRGDLSKLRAQLLEQNGFVKVEGRWRKP